jgi:hypothetical protein
MNVERLNLVLKKFSGDQLLLVLLLGVILLGLAVYRIFWVVP